MVKNIPENVALNKSSQSAFSKAIKTIKSRVKKGEIEVPTTAKTSQGPSRGVVYLSHIPHGFYEDEMEKYFTQFGEVTRLKLARSKKTGRSKGYAFIEFENNEVAQIAAETMNNYLMCTKLVKAKYLAPEEVSEAVFYGRKLTPANCPGVAAHNRRRKLSNRRLSAAQVAKKQMSAKKGVGKMQHNLQQLGIHYSIQMGGVMVGQVGYTCVVPEIVAAKEEDTKPPPKAPRKSTTPVPSKSPKRLKLTPEPEIEDTPVVETPKRPTTPKSKKTPQSTPTAEIISLGKKNTPVGKKETHEKPLSAKKTPVSEKKPQTPKIETSTQQKENKKPESAKKTPKTPLGTPKSKNVTPKLKSAEKITVTEVPEKVKKGRKSVINLKTPSPRRTRSGKILAGKSPLKTLKVGQMTEEAVTPAKRITRKSIAVMKRKSPATPKVNKRYSLTPALM